MIIESLLLLLFDYYSRFCLLQVAGIVGRADILATLFFLMCFASYHR